MSAPRRETCTVRAGGIQVIYFRCGQCAGAVRANDDEAGQAIACPRCGHANVCPERPATRPVPPRPRTTGSAGSAIWLLVVLFVAGSAVWLAWTRILAPETGRAAYLSASPVEARQQELLEANIDAPGDVSLGRLFHDINVHHFDGRLSQMPVMWEPRLAEVGALAAQAFTLEGMFGYIGDREIILINTNVRSDAAAVRRVLSHEMVHAWLHAVGASTTDHGPVFQAELKRLASEGAFEGIVATDRERADLRTWLETEATRLDAEHDAVRVEGEEVTRERSELDRQLAAINARIAAGDRPTPAELAEFNARRDDYNQRAEAANARAARGRDALAEFNRQVERYNLMLVYPDGMADDARLTPRTLPGVVR